MTDTKTQRNMYAIPGQWLRELLALCGPEQHELRERVIASASPALDAEAIKAEFLERTGQYLTNDASREACIAEAVAAERDAAFEVVRNRLCGLQRYSFMLDDDGVVRRTQDRTGNWIEFDDAHALFDPVAVDAALAANAPPAPSAMLIATRTALTEASKRPGELVPLPEGFKEEIRKFNLGEPSVITEMVHSAARCDRPPVGWTCSRPPGHDGPCAATPAMDESFEDRISDWAHGDALDADRYRTWRDNMIADTGPAFHGVVAAALPPGVGVDRRPTAEEWDAAIDAARAAQAAKESP